MAVRGKFGENHVASLDDPESVSPAPFSPAAFYHQIRFSCGSRTLFPLSRLAFPFLSFRGTLIIIDGGWKQAVREKFGESHVASLDDPESVSPPLFTDSG